VGPQRTELPDPSSLPWTSPAAGLLPKLLSETFRARLNEFGSTSARRRVHPLSASSSFGRFLLSVTLLFIGTAIAVSLFDQFFPAQPGVLGGLHDTFRLAIIVLAGGLVILLTRRLRLTIAGQAGAHLASMITFFMIILTAVGVFFGILNTLQVSTETLLLGGGIFSIVVGLVISTLFGNVISGALMLTTFPFKVGDGVMVNNVPGRIEQITTLYTSISTNSGGETIIPNSAIITGSITISKLPLGDSGFGTRLHYSVGDRVYTSYTASEGIVTEITPFYTKVLLDTGREAAIPNSGIFSGMVHVAVVKGYTEGLLGFSLKVDWDAEKTVSALTAAATDLTLFKSPLKVEYAGLEGKTVELKVTCVVDPTRKDEAKSALLKAAYLISRQSEAA
jgi:small-conductance mechanosensitive channel